MQQLLYVRRPLQPHPNSTGLSGAHTLLRKPNLCRCNTVVDTVHDILSCDTGSSLHSRVLMEEGILARCC